LGHSWTYELQGRAWRDSINATCLYDVEDDVPPALTLGQALELARSHPIGDIIESPHGSTTLTFVDSTSQTSGELTWDLTGQSTFSWSLNVDPGRGSSGSKAAADAGIHEGTGGRFGVDGMIRGADRWFCTTERMGYFPSPSDCSLFYLTADLVPGSHFDLRQDCPNSGVTFQGLVVGEVDIETPAGSFEGVLECFYFMDYGVAVYTEDSPEILGYLRMFDYGFIYFAPDIGPTFSYCRYSVAHTPAGVDDGWADLTMALTESSLLE